MNWLRNILMTPQGWILGVVGVAVVCWVAAIVVVLVVVKATAALIV